MVKARQRNGRSPQVADIGLAAVMGRVDGLANEIQGLRGDIGLLVAELRADRPSLSADHEIISQALAISKDDADFFQVQAVGALHRLSDKLTGIATLLMHANGGQAAGDLEQVQIVQRRPRAVPTISRGREKEQGKH